MTKNEIKEIMLTENIDNAKNEIEYVLNLIKLHFENGYSLDEFDLIIIDPKKIIENGRELPKQIAFSIVISYPEKEENGTQE